MLQYRRKRCITCKEGDGRKVSDKQEAAKRRNTQSGRQHEWNVKNEHTSDNNPAPRQQLPLSAAPRSPTLTEEKHKNFMCKGESLDGYVYPVLDHQLEATMVTESGKRRPTKLSMITITQAALAELRSLNGKKRVDPSRPTCRTPQGRRKTRWN